MSMVQLDTSTLLLPCPSSFVPLSKHWIEMSWETYPMWETTKAPLCQLSAPFSRLTRDCRKPLSLANLHSFYLSFGICFGGFDNSCPCRLYYGHLSGLLCVSAELHMEKKKLLYYVTLQYYFITLNNRRTDTILEFSRYLVVSKHYIPSYRFIKLTPSHTEVVFTLS